MRIGSVAPARHTPEHHALQIASHVLGGGYGSRIVAELRKAKNISVASLWQQLETNTGRAQLLGTYEVFSGDWKELFRAPERFEAVTREQVQQVAAKVLRRENRRVGVLVPEQAPQQAPSETKQEAAR